MLNGALMEIVQPIFKKIYEFECRGESIILAKAAFSACQNLI